MNARMMTLTMDGEGALGASGPARWLAMVLDWPLRMRRIGEVHAGAARSGSKATVDNAPRRRRGRHPDAPPRRPLLASRDLPSVGATHQFRAPVIAPVAPPRSPAPLSDAEIAQLMAAATARPIAIPVAPDMPAERLSANAVPLPALPATIADDMENDAAAIEAALDKALATLRKLAEQTQAKRRR